MSYLLESPRPRSPSQGLQAPLSNSETLDFLSTYLGIDSLMMKVSRVLTVVIATWVYTIVVTQKCTSEMHFTTARASQVAQW